MSVLTHLITSSSLILVHIIFSHSQSGTLLLSFILPADYQGLIMYFILTIKIKEIES